MRTTKSKKPITVASVCVAAVACAVGAYRFVYLPLRPADVSHARISINATGKFDESQIDGAVKAVDPSEYCSLAVVRPSEPMRSRASPSYKIGRAHV